MPVVPDEKQRRVLVACVSGSVRYHVPSTFLGNADLQPGDSQGKRTPVCAYSQLRRRNRIRQIEPNAQHRRGSGRTAYAQASRSGDWRCKEPFIGWLPINRNPDVLSPNGGWHVRPGRRIQNR